MRRQRRVTSASATSLIPTGCGGTLWSEASACPTPASERVLLGGQGRSRNIRQQNIPVTEQTTKGYGMSFIAWIILGLISGFIASKIVNKSGDGLIVDILLGIVGAFLGGWLFNEFGMPGVTGVNLYSMLVAVIGAILFLVLYHALFRRRA
jgi:uncharacterized membrane protein YeaQ/YmgE (transglycosylase-associated protein family)